MKAIAAGLRRHGLLIAASLVIAGLSAKRRLAAAEQKAAQAFQAGVNRGLEYACTTLDPISSEPFFIFDDLSVPWASLVPNLALVYGPEKQPTKQWTTLAVCGTFPVNGQPPPAGEVKSDGENLCFSKPGEYYLRTTVGDFKILLLDRQAKADDRAMAIAAFVSRNNVASMADARKIQPNYGYYMYQRPDKALRKFFASDQPLGFQCGYVAEFLNFVLHKKNFQVRRIQLLTEKGPGHVISEVFLPDSRRWVAVDPMYGAVLVNREGMLLSIEQLAKLTREQPGQVSVKDIAGKRWLKYPFGNFMHEFTWTPDVLDAPCVDPAKYCEMVRDCTFQYWYMEYDELFRWAKVDKFSWDGQKLLR
jgi:hypothetical protein